MDVIAIFDIGRVNKKFLLYDAGLNPVQQEEKTFAAKTDDNGVVLDDIDGIASWMRSCLSSVVRNNDYTLRGLNFTSYESGPLFTDEHWSGLGARRKINPELHLPETAAGTTVSDVEIEGKTIKTGYGINDSSAALLPYFAATKEQFILISAGSWCVFMNPFNTDPPDAVQIKGTALSGVSVNGRLVRSSQFFLGQIHDMNVVRLDDYFGVTREHYKTIRIKSKKISRLLAGRSGRVFFRHGIPPEYVDTEPGLSQFLTYADAYHQMMCDLVDVSLESYRLIIPADDMTEVVYITGGFSKNDTFVRLLAARLPEKRVFTTDIADASALGAAMVIYEDAMGRKLPPIFLGLKAIINNKDD